MTSLRHAAPPAESRAASTPLNVPGDAARAAKILAAVRAYVPTLRARAQETEQLRRVPDETIRDLHNMGVFRACMPVEYGGYALTPSQLLAIYAEISTGCGSTGWVVWVTSTAQQWATWFDPKFQDEMFTADWVGPLNAGVLSLQGPGKARRVEGGYMLQGKWPWCSGCHNAYSYHLGALEQEDGSWVLAQVMRSDVKILDDWKVMGQRGTGSNTVTIDEEIFVPDYRVRNIAEIFGGSRIGPDPQGVLFQTNLVLLTSSLMAAVGLGIARGAVQMFEQKIFTRGISNSIYDKQSAAPVTHILLGKLHCMLLTAQKLAESNVATAEELARSGAPVDALQIARSKLETAYIAETCGEITALVMRNSGASSIMENNIFQRLFRDSRVATLHAHTMIETCTEEYGRARVAQLQEV